MNVFQTDFALDTFQSRAREIALRWAKMPRYAQARELRFYRDLVSDIPRGQEIVNEVRKILIQENLKRKYIVSVPYYSGKHEIDMTDDCGDPMTITPSTCRAIHKRILTWDW